MRTRAWLPLAGVASLLAGCAVPAVGRPLPPGEVRAIERGVTTADQVRERFGEPSGVTPGAVGIETWRYRFVSRHSGYLQTVLVCDAVGALPVLLGAGSEQIGTPPYNASPLRPCSPMRREQELSLVIDGGVVASYTYESRMVLLEAYRQRTLPSEVP